MAPSSSTRPGLSNPRSIRSFVRRDSRMTSGQKKALEKYWTEYGIEAAGGRPDLDREFGRRAPRVLDIGSGMGDATVQLAANYPQFDWIAVEVHRPGVGNTLRLGAERRLSNLRVISEDIVTLLEHGGLDNAFDKVLILFPDPWPKKRHHKRRLIRESFIRCLLPCMKPHGRLYIATDWEDYAGQILAICDQSPELLNLAGRGHYAPRPAWRPRTKFESRGQNLGHAVRDFAYAVRRPASPR